MEKTKGTLTHAATLPTLKVMQTYRHILTRAELNSKYDPAGLG